MKDLFDDKVSNLESTLTFFLGRFTSSFIEAHLFKVWSRLKKKKKQEEQARRIKTVLNKHKKKKEEKSLLMSILEITVFAI